MEFSIRVVPENITFNFRNEFEQFRVFNHYGKTYRYTVYYDEKKYSLSPSKFNIRPKKEVNCKITLKEEAFLNCNGGLEQICIMMFDPGEISPEVALGIHFLNIQFSSDNSKLNKKPKIVGSTQNNLFMISFALLLLGFLVLTISPFYFSTLLQIILVIFLCIVAFKLYYS